ncbi:MAG: c-type cytochrome biogenesis protein CcsB [Proteobacteria bacterium]|nr:MAG: c-type cytochrome biogenesis protein CcsB [Pseudomonadota bacterium]
MSVPQEAMQEFLNKPSLLQKLKPLDLIWAVLLIIGTVYAFIHYSSYMDIFEQSFLILSAASLIALGWFWRSIEPYTAIVTLFSLLSIGLYSGVYANGELVFGLKYLFSSQSAIMWMSALFILATAFYLGGLIAKNDFLEKTGSGLTWTAAVMGFTGLMVRWYESYLVDPEFGHIPVSNLYEVFILFCVITALIYLYYEQRYSNRKMGFFVSLVISAAVGFLLWYSFDRGAHEIRPLVPALKSYWMKIHVPANFIGYGAFALAAMTSVAYLIKHYAHQKAPDRYVDSRLPSLTLIDDITYKAIALGFAFFTIATVLGAMWAAEAWGSYWSWDPKETWALIVWLNYAAWLHLRFTKGWRGVPMAWWAIIGLLITLIAFLGVNMFLSGLHAYGEL